MTKTPVTYKETLQGILEIHEIERIIMDNLIHVQKYVLRNHRQLAMNQETTKLLHKLLASSLFEEGGTYRKHDVELGTYQPPQYYKLHELMKNWEDDFAQRRKHVKTTAQKIELCAWLVHRFLWIHPFFDYNGRVSRLLGELCLLHLKLPIISFRATRRGDFVKAVQEATHSSNLGPLIDLIASRI